MAPKKAQNELPKSDLFYVFKGMGPRVPHGGPRDPPKVLKVIKKTKNAVSLKQNNFFFQKLLFRLSKTPTF